MKNVKIKIVSIVCFLAVLSTLLVPTYARYTGTYEDDILINSSKMYFDSDLLSVSGATNNVNEELSYDIDLNNFIGADKSTVDIDYSVVVTGGTTANTTGTIGVAEGTDTITVSPDAGATEFTVTVTAKPYDVVLTGTFKIQKTGGTGVASTVTVVPDGSFIGLTDVNVTIDAKDFPINDTIVKVEFEGLMPMGVIYSWTIVEPDKSANISVSPGFMYTLQFFGTVSKAEFVDDGMGSYYLKISP